MVKNDNRTLSENFITKLEEGKGQFKGILSTLKSDQSLDMEMRRGKIEVYYRGAFLFEMEESGEFNFVNEIEKHRLSFIELIKEGKRIIDTENKVKPELEISQLIVKESNRGNIAKTTDFFIIDREYKNTFDAQFDLIALHWDNDRHAHHHPQNVKLAIIEVKNGTGAANGGGTGRHHDGQLCR